MLRLAAGQVESLWDEVLAVEVRELPEDLARIDALLGDPALLATIAMETYVRLMVVKQRSGWGYETLVRESRTPCTCGASA